MPAPDRDLKNRRREKKYPDGRDLGLGAWAHLVLPSKLKTQ